MPIMQQQTLSAQQGSLAINAALARIAKRNPTYEDLARAEETQYADGWKNWDDWDDSNYENSGAWSEEGPLRV